MAGKSRCRWACRSICPRLFGRGSTPSCCRQKFWFSRLRSFRGSRQPRTALDGITVFPRPTTHLDVAREQIGNRQVESFLFEILGEGKRLIYSGDLGSAEDLRGVLDKPADLLICELAHFPPEELIGVLRGAQIGTLCLTHVSTELDERRGDLQMLFESELSGVDTVYLPDDSETLDI